MLFRSQAFGIEQDFWDHESLATEGEANTFELLRDLRARRLQPAYVDIRFCNGGCIGGPGRNNRLTRFAKQDLIQRYVQQQDIPYNTQPAYGHQATLPAWQRSFHNHYQPLEQPSGASIRNILQQTNKFRQQDELDCGACGYDTCREHAIAVYQGLAEADMCLPFSLKRLQEDKINLAQKYELAQHALSQEYGEAEIIGNDAQTQEVLRLVSQVGPTPTTVLIRGESGTGKELTARQIHRQSPRQDKPLVTVNCTTLSDNLLESELFGHKKGAFTGALEDKKGLFEAAKGGTVFLDEIGDITPKLQAELLRFLDSGEIRPVGANSSRKVDVRLIAATNKNLEDGVRHNWFREDLFYRLNIFTITMPPLRNRLPSLEELIHQFLRSASRRLNKSIHRIDPRAVEAMGRYHWPGNIRELQNIIERAAVLTQSDCIYLENLPVIFNELLLPEHSATSNDRDSNPGFQQLRDQQLSRVEKQLLCRYLKESQGNVSQAAHQAGLPRRSFYRLLQRYAIDPQSFRRMRH